MIFNDYHIKSLANTDFDEIFECNKLAFKDYPFQWNKDALYRAINRRGYHPALSFGAFYNEVLVSFTLNGIGEYQHVPTAYDTGTGTVAEHRGKGLASTIFEYSIPFLKNAGIQQYILEVLDDNTKAISVYKKQGFEVSRVFDCFRVNVNEYHTKFKINSDIQLKEIDLIQAIQHQDFFDFNLSWQNNFQALCKNPEHFYSLGAFQNNTLIAIGIIEPDTGDVPILAVKKSERRNSIASTLFNALIKKNNADIIKLINIENSCQSMLSFMNTIQIPKIVSQYEMKKNI